MVDLSSLNEEQKQSVLTTEGYVRVIASPGSGKTRALTHRFAYLVDDLKTDPQNILCITYTNKAADEMRERIIKLLSTTEYDLQNISTIHSYCTRFLKSYFQKHYEYNYSFDILDESALNKSIKATYKNLDLEYNAKKLSEFKKILSDYKINNLTYVPYVLGMTDNFNVDDERIKRIIDISKKRKALFFDDLICAAIYLLENDNETLKSESERFKYILVDEFQDTSFITYSLIKMLSNHNKNLFVVGDVDQSIYSFIHAEPDILLNQFTNDFSNAKTLYMNNNYRSTEEIIEASNVLIQNNLNRPESKKAVSATSKKGIKPVYSCVSKEIEIVHEVVRIIKHLHDDLFQEYKDIFLICRNNYEPAKLRNFLESSGIPYNDSRSINKDTTNAPVVDELLSCLMFSKNSNPFDLAKLNLYQELGISESVIEDAINMKIDIEEYLQSNKEQYESFLNRNYSTKQVILNEELSVIEKITSIVGIHNILSRYELEEAGFEFVLIEGQPLSEFLSYIKKLDDQNMTLWEIIDRLKLDNSFSSEKSCNGVKILTAHGSKGLEAKNVIVYGKALGEFGIDEEARRLAYVAITRAEERLFMVQPQSSCLINEIKSVAQNIEDYFEIQLENVDIKDKYYKELNDEKKKGLDILMSGENVFLTGEAGTGKTYLLNRYIKYLNDFGKNIIICAPTGIAASNYPNGRTIHSAFELKPYPSVIYDETPGYKTCDVLIIDEISMCRLDMFEYMMNMVLNAYSKGYKVQVIVCGDFFQLPPVVIDNERSILKELFEGFNEGFAFESKTWNEMNFKAIWLKEIFRQKDNKDNFVDALNSIRRGKDVDKYIKLINDGCSKEPNKDAIEIHSKNAEVCKYNNQGLSKCNGEEYIYKAEIYGNDPISPDLNIENEIHLKPGARVMMTRNSGIGTNRIITYRNGSCGTVVTCTNDYIDIVLDEGGCARISKHKFPCYGELKIFVNSDGTKEVIQEETNTVVHQLPIKLAYAITIHKSQGQTYEKVNLNPDGWENGQLYVALSRIKSLSGLYLYKPIEAKVIKTSQSVIDFYNNLETE